MQMQSPEGRPRPPIPEHLDWAPARNQSSRRQTQPGGGSPALRERGEHAGQGGGAGQEGGSARRILFPTNNNETSKNLNQEREKQNPKTTEKQENGHTQN